MSTVPLAEALRPKSLDEVVGQEHLSGEHGLFRKFVSSKFLPSLVFWGPPGTGKTTFARLLATLFEAHFESKSAVTTGLDEIRRIIKESKERKVKENTKTILFIDEIHRFNKAQQDALLPHVEDGTFTFIGATTENPSFEVIAPLLSRCRVIVLKPLEVDHMAILIKKGLETKKKEIDTEAQNALITLANGDARALLTILEIAMEIARNTKILQLANIEEASQKQMLQYDKKGDEHYNTISAFIKSLRASQPDAALYYLARMIEAGEDSLFIARRMVIFASEDIGMAQPTALVVANAVFDACHKIGYPEASINLAHGVVYLATAKKDRKANDGLMAAMSDVKTHGNLPIPMHIRNAPTKLMKELGYGKGYEKYTTESYLPDKLKEKKYYED